MERNITFMSWKTENISSTQCHYSDNLKKTQKGQEHTQLFIYINFKSTQKQIIFSYMQMIHINIYR